jgi:hypothetical protein
MPDSFELTATKGLGKGLPPSPQTMVRRRISETTFRMMQPDPARSSCGCPG